MADPARILVITFSKAAALEMKQRYFACLPPDAPHNRTLVTFGTFHAVFFQILRASYNLSGENILREEERSSLITQLLTAEIQKNEGMQRNEAGQMGINGQGMQVGQLGILSQADLKELVISVGNEISLVKNEQINLEYFYSTSCSGELFRNVYRGYAQQLKTLGKLDFDDMLVYTCELLKEREDIRAAWQKRFTHVLIDEFQDINALQYQAACMLAAPQNELYAVGDDDQSIYRFRGAKPELMQLFTKDYPDATVYLLGDNFRCSGAITRAAGRVIAENKNRFPKDIRAVPQQGEKVHIRSFSSLHSQADYLMDQVRKLHETGIPYAQIAILTRTNTGGRYLAERFLEQSIPLQMKDVSRLVYDHWIAGDVFAMLRLGMGGRERKDFLRVANRPLRYIGRDALDGSVISFERLRCFYRDKPWMIERIDKWEADLDLLGRMKPFAAVNFIRYGMEYGSWLRSCALERDIPEEELSIVLDELQESARSFDTVEEWFAHIRTFREEVRRQSREGRVDNASDAIVFSTFHASKGLEYEAVFIPDLNEDIVPHHKARGETDLEEERRLLYVGMTRAKKYLYLSFLTARYGRSQHPSRFLRVLLEK